MQKPRYERNLWVLGAVGLLGLLHNGALFYWHTLTGVSEWDGILGVVLGLFICSHPAGNFLNVLLFGGSQPRQGMTKTGFALWIGFNCLVLFIGWLVITTGTIRFNVAIH